MTDSPEPLVAEVVLDAHAEVGEGPTWDPRSQRLWWVDIPRGAVHDFHPASGADHVEYAGQPVGAAVVRHRGGMMLAVRDGFAVLQDRRVEIVAEVEAENIQNRMNDGKVGPDGTFWAGTMALDSAPGAGALYRLHADHRVDSLLHGLTIPNGIDWSPDGQTMYLIDSGQGSVTAFSYDQQDGAISDPATLLTIPAAEGLPDGMTVDAAGYLWVAVWGGAAVRRYAPDGTLVGAVMLPVSQVTSCAFGGPTLHDLYITSASDGLSLAQRTKQPHAGALFRVRPGVAGRLPHPCRV